MWKSVLRILEEQEECRANHIHIAVVPKMGVSQLYVILKGKSESGALRGGWFETKFVKKRGILVPAAINTAAKNMGTHKAA